MLKPFSATSFFTVIFIALLFLVLTSPVLISAQTNRSIVWSGSRIEMLFPEGKSKALILSYDDGRTEDRRLVRLMNAYGLVGTFHLNSNKLGTDGYLTRAEIRELFKGHEVSVHSANHPNLPDQSKVDIVYEIVEDRRELERLVGYPVRGMAYPFGNTDDAVIGAMSGLGIEYARTVSDTNGYMIPADFLRWHPTIHQFGKAFWKPNDAENDKRELERYYQVIDGFLKADSTALLDIWGHSWEFGEESKWAETERTFKLLARRPDICYTTQIAIVDYINAFRGLKFSVEKNIVLNQSSTDVFIKVGGKPYKVPAGKSVTM
ncbi:MAG: polysaccharide deacetylase family protein [Pyrinomonadaceae bacterium]|nr:polysaccharide deacetylase family protein [Pyrinomonadaceae bacterium]MBP6211963.1 polysaccharide deacetylase family protein [Pyrinomonadaceae bacterium]